MAVDTRVIEEQVGTAAPAPPDEARYYRPSTLESIRDAWRSRHLLWFFGGEAVRRMFVLTILGPLWIIIHVAVDIGGKTFLFGSVLNVRTPRNVPYFIFLLTGMLGWTLFQQTVLYGVKSFQRYRRYADRLHFPLLILPMAAGGQAVLQFFLYLLAVLAGLSYYAVEGRVYFETGAQVLFVPLGLMLCLLFGWGLSMLLAPLNYRKRDVRLVLKYGLQFWMYVTPVVYPLENLHGMVLIVAKLNPLAPMVEMIKFGLIGGGNIGVHFVLYAIGAATGTFFAGLLVVNRYGPSVLARPLLDDGIADDDDDDDGGIV